MSSRSRIGLLLIWAGLALAPEVTEATTVPPPPVSSVAVMPFANTCGEPKQDYFAAGISEDLRDMLARINELQVAGRASSLSFQTSHVGYQAVARKLNVAALLDGGVCRFGDAVRMTMRLIDGASGLPSWRPTALSNRN